MIFTGFCSSVQHSPILADFRDDFSYSMYFKYANIDGYKCYFYVFASIVIYRYFLVIHSTNQFCRLKIYHFFSSHLSLCACVLVYVKIFKHFKIER